MSGTSLRNLSLLFLSFLAGGFFLCYAAEEFSGRITSDGINLRCDSRVSAEVIATLKRGDKVGVVSGSYDWYKIRLPKDSPSYVRKDMLECIREDCLSAKVIKQKVNIRLKPRESSAIIGRADKDEVLNVIRKQGDWYEIEPVHESYGWVHKKFVERIEER